MTQLNKNTLLWARLSDTAVIPTKSEENAGYDLYADFKQKDLPLVVTAGQVIHVPTGIATVLHPSKALIIKERGSVGSKGIACRCGVVDSGYRGEIFIALQNNTKKDLYLIDHDKQSTTDKIEYLNVHKAVAQALIVDVPAMNTKEITKEELADFASERGEGKLGSSGK